MTWTPETPLTVGDLRRETEGLPDDAQVFVDGMPDRPIVGAIQSQQIPHENIEAWEQGDPLVTGLELWLGGDDEFPAPRCNHHAETVARIKAQALREAIQAAHTEQALLKADGRLDEELNLLQHWSATRGWLASRIRAIERGDEPDWPDAMNTAGVSDE